MKLQVAAIALLFACAPRDEFRTSVRMPQLPVELNFDVETSTRSCSAEACALYRSSVYSWRAAAQKCWVGWTACGDSQIIANSQCQDDLGESEDTLDRTRKELVDALGADAWVPWAAVTLGVVLGAGGVILIAQAVQQ